MLERIDHLVCLVPDLAVAARYEQLGLVLTPEAHHAGMGTANRACFVGESSENATYLELLTVTDASLASAAGRQDYVDVLARGGGAAAVTFGVSDIRAAAASVEAAGYAAPVSTVHRPDGSKVCDIARIDSRGALPFTVSLIAYPETWDARFERSKAAGRFAHRFPLKRLDHLAAMAPDVDAARSFWADVLGVPVHGEIRTPAMTILQLKVGDAIFELLGPAGPESPMAGRPAALASMAAWEVSGPLDEAVALARERGFTCSDAEPGVIPGTRRASIPAAELGGAGMQLLEYV